MNITAISPTREKYPLSERKIIKKVITSIMGIVYLFIFISFFAIGPIVSLSQVGNLTPIIGFIEKFSYVYPFVFLFLIVLTYLYQRWYFQTYYYEISHDYLIIKKGPITPKEITVPWERIQDVYVDQDLWDRIFGLYDVHLSTATLSSGVHAHIDGVGLQAANGLKELLLGKVQSRISRPSPTK